MAELGIQLLEPYVKVNIPIRELFSSDVLGLARLKKARSYRG
jgi:hypothetical protein